MHIKEKIPDSFIVKTDRFNISLIRLEDVSLVFETMNSKKTAEIISFLKWPITLDQAISWCERAVNGLRTQTDFLFLVRNRTDSSPVGCICLLRKEEPDVMEVGYWVTESWQGKGCATEMLKAMIKVAFEVCGVTKVVATAAIGNPASLRVLENQGFRIIGRKELPTVKGTILICDLLELNRK